MKNNSLKSLLVLLCAGLNFSAAIAQGAYFTLGTGYNLPASTQTLDAMSFSNETITDNTTTYKQNYVSLGKGLSACGAFGYMFNENIGAELGISYLMGSTWESVTAYNSSTSGSNMKFTDQVSSKMTRINPQIVMSMEANKITPYVKVGLLLGMGSMSVTSKSDYSSGMIEETLLLNGGIATGFTTIIGASYALNDKISLFGDLNLVNMSYSPTKGMITKYTEDGVDLLPSFDPIDKEIQFVDSYVEDDNIQPSITEPAKALKIKFPFSSAGIHIGLKYTL
jgi:opacity protein-like surface antigen